MEARTLMLASNNVLSPVGEPSIDAVARHGAGPVLRHRERTNGKGEGMVISARASPRSSALENGVVEITAKISVRLPEWTKNKDTGEFGARDQAGGHHRGPRCFRDPARGPAVQQPEQGTQEVEISRLINTSFRKCGLKGDRGAGRQAAAKRFARHAPVSPSPSTTCWSRRKHEIIERTPKAEVKEIEIQHVRVS